MPKLHRGTIRLTRIEAHRLHIVDHHERGIPMEEPLSVEQDNIKKGEGYVLRDGLRLVRFTKPGDTSQELVPTDKDNEFESMPYAIVKVV